MRRVGGEKVRGASKQRAVPQECAVVHVNLSADVDPLVLEDDGID